MPYTRMVDAFGASAQSLRRANDPRGTIFASRNKKAGAHILLEGTHLAVQQTKKKEQPSRVRQGQVERHCAATVAAKYVAITYTYVCDILRSFIYRHACWGLDRDTPSVHIYLGIFFCEIHIFFVVFLWCV